MAWVTDNVGYIAWLVPIIGICTMFGTEVLACLYHFTCSKNYPTLSYAATFKPEAYVFTSGMSLTALCILVSVLLFFWYLQIHHNEHKSTPDNTVAAKVYLGFGVTSAFSLFGLAVMDMRYHHVAHLWFTIVFFLSTWVMLLTAQLVRKRILQFENCDNLALTRRPFTVLRQQSFWRVLCRSRRLDNVTAYVLGHLFVCTGLASTLLFAIFFLCANDMWPNPLGLTALQEAFFEALAIVCQLFFMGTLSCELAQLHQREEFKNNAIKV
ncbi:hypothetical protein CCR75_001876 [Bremia lactucae]|uniref:CWH43-like N-terminal domain-containing protein n=1 Tax=Bremia lactucae TaxID=4779 RepID=A0A976FIP0_BRELC|nr:hypothetical protein CCR75_001876 [Bremia lactucae]